MNCLGHMLPAYTVGNPSEHCQRNPNFFSHFSLGTKFRKVSCPNLSYKLISKLCHSVRFTLSWTASSLVHPVFVVVAACSKKKVFGIAAWAIVAFMKDALSFRNRTNSQLKRSPVRPHNFVIPRKFSVTLPARTHPVIATPEKPFRFL